MTSVARRRSAAAGTLSSSVDPAENVMASRMPISFATAV
jgi:hypothetical protein